MNNERPQAQNSSFLPSALSWEQPLLPTENQQNRTEPNQHFTFQSP